MKKRIDTLNLYQSIKSYDNLIKLHQYSIKTSNFTVIYNVKKTLNQVYKTRTVFVY